MFVTQQDKPPPPSGENGKIILPFQTFISRIWWSSINPTPCFAKELKLSSSNNSPGKSEELNLKIDVFTLYYCVWVQNAVIKYISNKC